MSLDVYLTSEKSLSKCFCPLCNNEHVKESAEEIYSSNITHNLSEMADAAGIYKELWRPDEIGITKAEQLIHPLAQGLKRLRTDPDKYKVYNASNGWGLYEHFVPFVENYLNACIENPNANVSVSR